MKRALIAFILLGLVLQGVVIIAPAFQSHHAIQGDTISSSNDTAIIPLQVGGTRATYYSVQNGSWDDPATWGGSGYPVSGDTAYVNDTVTLTGSQACLNVIINSSGILVFDAVSAVAVLTMDSGGSLTNYGQIRFYNNTVNACEITTAAGYTTQATWLEYNFTDWDYGGSGSKVELQDIVLALKTHTTTGGSGVTITVSNVTFFAKQDDTPTASVIRFFKLSDGDTLTMSGDWTLNTEYVGRYGTSIYVTKGGSGNATINYTGTPTLYMKGNGDYAIIYDIANVTVYNVDVADTLNGWGGIYKLYTSLTVKVNIEGNVTSSSFVNFANIILTVGGDTYSSSMNLDGVIALSGAILQAKNPSYPVNITTTGLTIKRDNVKIGHINASGSITTEGNSRTVEITDNSYFSDLIIASTDTLIVDSGVDMDGSSITVNGTLDWQSTTVNNITFNLDNAQSYSFIDNAIFRNCTNAGTKVIDASNCLDGGGNVPRELWIFGGPAYSLLSYQTDGDSADDDSGGGILTGIDQDGADYTPYIIMAATWVAVAAIVYFARLTQRRYILLLIALAAIVTLYVAYAYGIWRWPA